MKYMAEDLYALPLSLLPCEPVDGCDTQYLNHSHKPIINPFKKSLDILMYNDALFSTPPLTLPPTFNYTQKNYRFYRSISLFNFFSLLFTQRITNTISFT